MNRLIDLTEKERYLIRASWKQLIKKAGLTNPHMFHEEFFKLAPGAQTYFEGKDEVDFAILNRRFRLAMDFIIGNLEMLEKNHSIIQDLGKTHKELKIESQYYEPFNQALINLIGEVVDKEFSKETKNAWAKMLSYLSYAMQKADPGKADTKFQKMLQKMFGPIF